MSGFTDSYTIVPSSLTIQGSNEFKYSLAPGGGSIPCDSSVGLSNLKVTNSFINISSNVSTPITFTNNGTGTTGTFLSGTYNYDDINTELTTLQVNSNSYLIDSIGDTITFANIAYSPNYHVPVLSLTTVPSALTGAYTGWTNPANMTLSGMTPTINLGSYGSILGFTGTHPPSFSSTNVIYLGTGAYLNAGMVLVSGSISGDNSLGSNESAGVLGAFYVSPTDIAEQEYEIQPNNIKKLKMNGKQNVLTLKYFCTNPQTYQLPSINSTYAELAVFRNEE